MQRIDGESVLCREAGQCRCRRAVGIEADSEVGAEHFGFLILLLHGDVRNPCGQAPRRAIAAYRIGIRCNATRGKAGLHVFREPD